ncbi:MAG: hypothetical protein Q4Q06_06960, partial [Bacteroidota bacterium]|nr:hypothetical protein [Bacteroidota bacterium]
MENKNNNSMNIKQVFNKLRPKNRKQRNIFGLVVFLVLLCVVGIVWVKNSKSTTIKQDYHIKDV